MGSVVVTSPKPVSGSVAVRITEAGCLRLMRVLAVLMGDGGGGDDRGQFGAGGEQGRIVQP